MNSCNKPELGLDMGCGENKRPGFISIDMRRTSSVDVIANARFLPFRDKSFDYVYSSHLIEHFGHREVRKVITEWVRVGGTIEIKCLYLRARSLLFFLNPLWQNVNDYHKCGFSYGLLKDLLKSAGIKDVKRVIKVAKGIPFLLDCLHVKVSNIRVDS